MKIDLSDKSAVVTGAGAGIGFAIARGLAAAGASVVLNGLTPDAVDRALSALKAALPAARLQGVAADLSDADGCAALIRAAPQADILVNNVGIY